MALCKGMQTWLRDVPLSYLSALAQRFQLLLRAIGLGIIAVLRGDEPKKVIVYGSRRAILSRSAVHLLPACVSLVLIAINLRGHFIGRELQGTSGSDNLKMGVLQVAAKMQELLIVASLATIILHVLRSKLIAGEGVPLGLVTSDKAFTQISYFWSIDFWGGILSYERRQWKSNCLFVVLVLVGGLVAALAGPATAVLMIPREMDWPTGGMIFWLNGSDAQLWPTKLNADNLGDYDCSTDNARLSDTRCPSSGFAAIDSHLSTWWNFPERVYQVPLQDESIRKVIYVNSGIIRDKDTWTYTTHGPCANLQDAAVNFYRNSLLALQAFHRDEAPYPAALDLAKTKSFEVETKVPAVRVGCMEHTNFKIEHTVINITFPKLDQFSLYRTGPHREGGRVIDITAMVEKNLKARELAVTNGSTFSLTPQAPSLLVIPLELSAGDASSLGLIIIRRLNATTISPVTCTVDARWADGRSIVESRLEGDDLQGHDFVGDRTRNIVRTELKSYDYITMALNYFHPQGKSKWKHIEIHPGWYNLLSPSISDASILDATSTEVISGLSNRTVLERLLGRAEYPTVGQSSDYEIGYKLAGLEVIISMLVTDGLSRVGWQLQRETWRLFPPWPYGQWHTMTGQLARTMVRIGKPVETFPLPSVLRENNSTRKMMQAKFTGYVMAATNWFDYISVAILILHAFVAVIHTVLGMWQRQTSEAWDSMSELLVLSQQSRPASPKVFKNTCAGIRSMKTMSRVATVEVSDPNSVNGPGTEELQLRFRDSWRSRASQQLPVAGSFYGAL